MSITRTITLAGQPYAIPPLPLRINRVVYPIVRGLSAMPADGSSDSFLERMTASNGALDVITDAEWDDLIEIAFQAASAATTGLTREAFNDMPILPGELLDAFFPIRLQTGAWLASTPDTDQPGDIPAPAQAVAA